MLSQLSFTHIREEDDRLRKDPLRLSSMMARKGRRCRVKSRLSKIFVFSVHCIGPRGIVVSPCGHGIADGVTE